MSKEDTVLGRVDDALGGARFRCVLEDGRSVIAYVSGKMKQNRVRVDPGHVVEIVLDPAGGNATNRIVWRK